VTLFAIGVPVCGCEMYVYHTCLYHSCVFVAEIVNVFFCLNKKCEFFMHAERVLLHRYVM